MGKLEFENIHNVIIDCLDKGSDNNLEVIGLWYYRFLKSDQEKFALHLPFYSIEFTKLTYTYVRLFTVGFNLLKQNELTNFDSTCLFDVFKKSSQTKVNDLTLDFCKKKDNFSLWGEDTLTKLDDFLPVFNKEKLIDFDKPKTIKNTFQLFKSIRNSNLIDTPILIGVDEKILSFNNIDEEVGELISEKQFLVKNVPDKSSFDDFASELEEEHTKHLNNILLFKYPYSKRSHPYLTYPVDMPNKHFKLVFNNRLAYNDILEEDIYLLQDEAKLATQLKYNIVDTNHNTELYELFKSFKTQWIDLELNKFTTPFPKYWFLFLNNSLTKEDWLIQFKKDFPAVAEKPIIRLVENIINEVIKLNWIKDEITDSTKILFPELKSNRKKRLEFIYKNFKKYIKTINQEVEFISSVDLNNYENVIVLDSFNIIDLVNKNQCDYNGEINILVPDFIYFGYQPWIKYHLFNYHFTPLLNGLREKLDTNFSSNKTNIEELKNKIINEITAEFKTYRSKYKVEIQEEDLLVDSDEKPREEDIEFTNEEEIENTKLDKERNKKTVLINQNLENELTISSTEKILLQKDTLLYVKAGSLRVADVIVRNNDIVNLSTSQQIIDKLVNYPPAVLNYQNRLFKTENVYNILLKNGLSIETQSHFKKKYLIEKTCIKPSIIPRSKKDWKIICEFLNIDHSAEQLAFIAGKGRTKQNELKKIYKSIIDLLLKNHWIGTIEDPNVITAVSEIVKQCNSIFTNTEPIEISGISESIISNILDQLKFTEIRTIKTIENE